MRTARVSGIVFLALAGGVVLSAQPNVVTKFGETQVQGRRALVHVTVAVPPGLEGNQVADEAIRNQGARPLEPAAYSTTGLVWPPSSPGSVSVRQNYNNAGAAVTTGLVDLIASQDLWKDTSKWTFGFDGSVAEVARCPSLVRECPGPQTADGNNDVGWLNIKGCCTLAVTWYLTSSPAEADMAINTRVNWGTYDLRTVLGHEQGHVAGLGHSSYTDALMYAYYAGPHFWLHADDRRGMSFLYPAQPITLQGTVSAQSSGLPIAGARVSVEDSHLYADTDGSGSYDITVPANEPLDVTARADGYTSKTESLGPSASGPVTLDFSLESSGGGSDGCTPRGKSGKCK